MQTLLPVCRIGCTCAQWLGIFTFQNTDCQMPSSYYGQDCQTDLDNIKLDALHLNSCPAEIIQQYLSPAGEEEEEEERGEQGMELELSRCSVIQNNVTVSILQHQALIDYIYTLFVMYCSTKIEVWPAGQKLHNNKSELIFTKILMYSTFQVVQLRAVEGVGYEERGSGGGRLGQAEAEIFQKLDNDRRLMVEEQLRILIQKRNQVGNK